MDEGSSPTLDEKVWAALNDGQPLPKDVRMIQTSPEKPFRYNSYAWEKPMALDQILQRTYGSKIDEDRTESVSS